MKLVFNINYHTVWGESLYLCGDLPELGSGDPHKALEMKLTSPDTWQLTMDLDSDPSDFNYWFVVKSPDKAWRFEWGKPHRYVAGSGIRSVLILTHGTSSRTTSLSIRRHSPRAYSTARIAISPSRRCPAPSASAWRRRCSLPTRYWP